MSSYALTTAKRLNAHILRMRSKIAFALQPKRKPGRPKVRRITITLDNAFIGRSLIGIGALLAIVPSNLLHIQPAPRTPQPVIEEVTTGTADLAHDYGPIVIDETLTSEPAASQAPLRIVIPTRGIDLPIVEAPVIDGYWELSETTASHGVGSASPGEIGNTVIFAHARDGLFLPIRDIEPDEAIYVLTKDRWHRYSVQENFLVTPDQVEVIAPTETETLTLFTCSGFNDSKRAIVTATPLHP